MFRLAQGGDKGRLDANSELKESLNWDTLLIVSTNESLHDHINASINNSDAGVVRVMEFEALPAPADGMTDAEARHFFDRLNENYGNAGAKYSQWLAENEDYAKKAVQAYDAKLSAKLATTSNERFWAAVSTASVMGAQFANKLGLCKFNVPELQRYLIGEFKSLRKVQQVEWESPEKRAISTVVRYMHEHTEYVIKAEGMPARGRGQPAIILDSMRQPAVARIGINDQTLRILADDFKNWYYDKSGAGFTAVISNLEAMGAKRTRGSVNAGTPYGSGNRLKCIDIPIGKSEFKSLSSWLEAPDTNNSDLG